MKKAIVLTLVALALCACEYGQTLEEAISSAGKPARQETRSTGETILVYERKTFDSENMNTKDAAVLVTFQEDPKSGNLEYWGIEFVPL